MPLIPDRKFSPRPLKSKDLNTARFILGLPHSDLRYLLGGSARTIAQGQAGEQILPPSLGILVRLLWNNPEDNPLPLAPDFDSVRKRFGQAFNQGVSNKDIPKTHASVLVGMRRGAGTKWSASDDQRTQPTPQIRRLFWVLSEWADKYGEEEAWNRWKKAAEEEAIARGTSLDEVLKQGCWPKVEGEVNFGKSAESADEEDSDD